MGEDRVEDDIVLKASGDGDDGDILISELIEQMQRFQASLDPEVRKTAFVRLVTYGDYSNAYLHFGRSKTKAEIAEEQRIIDAYEAEEKAKQEAKDRATFERLKAKFDGGSDV